MSAKLWFSRTFYRLVIAWWWMWSKVYRFFYHRKYRKIALPQGLHIDSAQAHMNKLTWSKDTWRELGDSVGDPRWVQYCLNQITSTGKQPNGALDCDDFACWAANVIHPGWNPKILSFSWMKDGKLAGHAVCACGGGLGQSLYYIGNWGKIGVFPNIRGICIDMMSRAKADVAIGWNLRDRNLKLISWGKGLPK